MYRVIGIMMLLIAAALPVSGAQAAQQVVAEYRVEGGKGEPVTRDLVFSSSGFADFVLRVKNGEDDGSRRASSALVSLNGAKILTTSDFNQQVAMLERAIMPRADDSNTLTATVRSSPDSLLLVQVLGTPVFNLPPDPGRLGEITLAGVDSNGNGIRDDVERWIYQTYPHSEKLRSALIQEYYSMQNMLLHAYQRNDNAVYSDMDALQRSTECLFYVHPDKPYKIAEQLKARIINTDARANASFEASRMLGGGTFQGRPLSKWKESCTFNPDEMAN